MEYEICEQSGKRCYSKVDAQRTVNLATKKHWKNKTADVPKRVYLCPFCSSYHLTKEARKNEKECCYAEGRWPGKVSCDTSMDLRITGVWPGSTSVHEWFLLETTWTDEKLLNI